MSWQKPCTLHNAPLFITCTYEMFKEKYNTTRYRVLSRIWKPGKPGDMNFICPGPEMAWNLSQKVRKPRQNKKFSRTPG